MKLTEIVLATFLGLSPLAVASASDCACSTECQVACEKGQSEECACSCGCKETKKCEHAKEACSKCHKE